MSQVPDVGKLGCSSSDCQNELHCFNRVHSAARKRKGRAYTAAGVCGSCGVSLVDWERVHRRDREDADYTFDALRHEFIRHHFWHAAISERALNHARRKGRQALYADVPKRLTQAIGKAHHPKEGQQVPVDEAKMTSAIQYAQHAVAACCRACLEKWHNIERGRDLTGLEIEYVTALVVRFLDARLPDLSEQPCHVPAVRRSRHD